jgi:hypothetical protein
MSLPVYPRFDILKLDYLSEFTRVLEESPPVISEWTFTNLYSWRNSYKLSVSRLDDFIICCSEAQGRRRFFSPAGKGDIKSAIEKVLIDNGGEFIRVPESVKSLFDNDSRFAILPDRDNSDYLYNTSDLIKLEGRKYDGKRNLIRKFEAEHSYEYVIIDKSNAKLCRDFEDAWCVIRDCDAVEGLNNERQAISEMVANFSSFGLIGGAIRVQGEIRAVAIAQSLNHAVMVMHVLKACPDITGLSQLIMREFIARQAAGSLRINLEQDLGIEGLRKSKLSYHPCAMVDKYTLTFEKAGIEK